MPCRQTVTFPVEFHSHFSRRVSWTLRCLRSPTNSHGTVRRLGGGGVLLKGPGPESQVPCYLVRGSLLLGSCFFGPEFCRWQKSQDVSDSSTSFQRRPECFFRLVEDKIMFTSRREGNVNAAAMVFKLRPARDFAG